MKYINSEAWCDFQHDCWFMVFAQPADTLTIRWTNTPALYKLFILLSIKAETERVLVKCELHLETLIYHSEGTSVISLWIPPELITHGASNYITKTTQGVLVSSLCNLCIHMSQSEQPCRVSWVLSEASSWAEYEHKWCFHSTLLSAVWILPQDLISMAAAFSLLPGLCYSMCAVCGLTHSLARSRSLTYLLPATVESFCLYPVSPVGFFPLIYSSILFPPSGSLFILVFSPTTYSSLVLSSFFFYLPPSPFFPASQPCINSSCVMIIPSSALSPHLLLHTFL